MATPVATRGLGRLVVVQAKLYLREPAAVFFTIAFAPLLLVLFGLIYGNKPSAALGGRGAMDVTVPAYIGIVIVTVGLIGIPVQTATSRDLGVLRRYRVTPLRPFTFLAADVVTYYAMTLTGTLLLIVVGRLAFGVRLPGNPGAVFAGFTLAALAFFALGYLLAALSPSARVAQTIGMVLTYPMIFLSGASIPLALLPSGIRRVADFIPLTYVVHLLQGLWYGRGWGAVSLDVAVLGALLAVSTGLAARVFRWE